MKKVLIFVIVAVMLALCLSACNGNGSWDITTTAGTTKAPEDFNDAFAIRGITFEKHSFSTSQSASFVALTTDDTLELVELGYDGDTVKEVYKALYINVEQYDAAQKESIKQSMEDNSAQAATIPGVTITHKIVDRYYIMTTEIKVSDDADAFDAAVRAGLLDFTNEGAMPLKMSDVENVLIAKDFIKM